MSILKVCLLVIMVACFSAVAGIWYAEPIAYESGKASKMAELATVFAPHGYEKIKGAKQDCEIKANETCRIYGGFAPKSMFMQPQVPELKRQKL